MSQPAVGGEHSIKEPFEQRDNSSSERLQYITYEHVTTENASNIAPPSACVTWTYMNTHERTRM